MRKKIEKIFWDMEIIGNRRKIKLTGRLVKIYNQKLIGYWKNVYFLELLGTYDSWKRRHRGLFSSCMNHARGN